MIAFLKLIHYKNLLMIILTMFLTKYALIDNFVTFHSTSHIGFFSLILAVVLIASRVYIINDIYDVNTDKINRLKK